MTNAPQEHEEYIVELYTEIISHLEFVASLWDATLSLEQAKITRVDAQYRCGGAYAYLAVHAWFYTGGVTSL